MSIREIAQKGKDSALKALEGDLFLVLVILLVALASFGLGRLSVEPKKEPVRIEKIEEGKAEVLGTQASDVVTPGVVVASRSGSKYHLPECPGARSIKVENKISFASAEEARAAGYEPAGNCPGL